MRRRWFAALAMAGCALLGPNSSALAQDYPTRQVKIVIAFSPSGAIDILGRFIADKLSQTWGQNVIVENRPGLGGTASVAKVTAALPAGAQGVGLVNLSRFVNFIKKTMTKTMQQAGAPRTLPIQDLAECPPLGMAVKVTPTGVEGRMALAGETLKNVADMVERTGAAFRAQFR